MAAPLSRLQRRAPCSRWGLLLLCTGAVACGSERSDPRNFTRAQLLDPESCRGCHQDYYTEWAASMHAQSSRDPVFLAMNRRGNQETQGALGSFCVQCHAPMAVLDKQTTDGSNLESLPNGMQGVTCYFCHSAAGVAGTHNNPLLHDTADPIALRAGIRAPASNPHHAGYSALLSGSQPDSSALCGSCHDVQLTSPPAAEPTSGTPVDLERTFAEWQGSVFAPGKDANNPQGISCIGCHMPPPARGAQGSIAPSGPATRNLHSHLFPGVDVALGESSTDSGAAGEAGFGTSIDNDAAVQSFLESTLRVARLCVEYQTDPTDRERIKLLVDVDNVGAGHAWPSGAAHDRRAWADIRVLVDEQVVYSSGEPEQRASVLAAPDADLWLLRDHALKSDGTDAHMFWDVASLVPGTIPGPITRVVGAPGYDNTHVVRSFPLALDSWIAAPFDTKRLRVEIRLRLQAIGYEVLDDLVASGHLEQSVRDAFSDRTLLLNRSLARADLIAQTPELARFGNVSFEWSALTLNSPYFAAPATRSEGTLQYLCAGMNRAP